MTSLGAIFDLRLLPLDAEKRFSIPPNDTNGFDLRDTDYVQRARINTGYIIHPEEILADNFALLVLQQTGHTAPVPRPDVIHDLSKLLSTPAASR